MSFTRLLVGAAFLVTAVIWVVPAQACSPLLKGVVASSDLDLCALADRYAAATAALKTLGFSNPDRIAEILAPRFINQPDWDKKKASSKVQYDPWVVYCPAPQTWASWEKGNQFVTREAKADLAAAKFSTLPKDWIDGVWALTLAKLNGGKKRDQFGDRATAKQITRDSAASQEQIEILKNLPYRNLVNSASDPDGNSRRGDAMVQWVGVKCFEDMDKREREKAQGNPWNLPSESLERSKKFFKKSNGRKYQCGYIRWAIGGDEVAAQLAAVVDTYNDLAARGGLNGLSARAFLAEVAHLQQWIIAIHGYDNGNGRTSRLLIERLLLATGLPAPILADQNDDLFATKAEWGQAIGEGLKRTVSVLESCVQNPKQAGCKQTSLSAPVSIAAGLCSEED